MQNKSFSGNLYSNQISINRSCSTCLQEFNTCRNQNSPKKPWNCIQETYGTLVLFQPFHGLGPFMLSDLSCSRTARHKAKRAQGEESVRQWEWEPDQWGGGWCRDGVVYAWWFPATNRKPATTYHHNCIMYGLLKLWWTGVCVLSS